MEFLFKMVVFVFKKYFNAKILNILVLTYKAKKMNLSKITFKINFKNKKYFFSIRKDNNKQNNTNKSTKKLMKIQKILNHMNKNK